LNGRAGFLSRLGVSWLPMNNLNVRAGAGLYSGGTPAVWVSNNEQLHQRRCADVLDHVCIRI
jgi:hypothetical protein